jgi:hypothetical protein
MAIPVVKVLKPKRSVLWGRGNILYRSINAGRKALQAGTSHYLGQKKQKLLLSLQCEGKQEYVWGTLGVFQQDYGCFSNDAF